MSIKENADKLRNEILFLKRINEKKRNPVVSRLIYDMTKELNKTIGE